MKYYLVIVQNNSAQAVYAYDDINAAKAAYHNELAYRGDNRESTLCVLLQEDGMIVMERDEMTGLFNHTYNELWERNPTPKNIIGE